MPQGIEVFNAGGSRVLGTADLITRVITTINVSSDGSYTLPFEQGARYAAYLVAGSPTNRGSLLPILFVNGLTLRWELYDFVGQANTIIVVRY